MEETLKHLIEQLEEYPNKIEARFVFQALQLYCKVKNKPQIELIDDGISLSWYSKDWGKWKFGEPNNRSLLSVHFFRNSRYHHFLWWHWEEKLKPVILVNAIGKVAEFTKEVPTVEDAFNEIKDYINHPDFTSK